MNLTYNDFTISNGELVLANSRGFSLVFFTSPYCEYCEDFSKYFNFVALRVTGCNFYVCDITVEKQIYMASQNTKTPITYVPLIFLFADGKIIGQYFPDEQKPENNINLLLKFLQETTTRLKPSQTENLPYGGIPYNLNTSSIRSKTKTCKITDLYSKMTYPKT
jgi:hypothetical protein